MYIARLKKVSFLNFFSVLRRLGGVLWSWILHHRTRLLSVFGAPKAFFVGNRNALSLLRLTRRRFQPAEHL